MIRIPSLIVFIGVSENRRIARSTSFCGSRIAAPKTFLESYDLTGKTIIRFATSGGSGIGKTNERLAPSCKGAKLMDGKAFKGNVGHQELAAWVEGLGL